MNLIPIYEPNISKYSNSAIDAIQSGWISNHGKYIKLTTDKMKEILGVKHIILMSNGTCATHCLFLSLKFKYPNITKIYVPNNCYVAAWNAVLMEYPKEIIQVMNMDLDTWNIDTSEDYINSLDKDAAVLIVHNLGNIINVPRLKKLRPDLIFVEDNCEGLFGKYENIYSGTFEGTLCSSVSFYGNKIITTGEGGAFMTNDDDVYNYISKVYSQGLSTERYLHDTHAYNYRMTNIQAAFLYDQLNNIVNILKRKRDVFNNYGKLLEDLINEDKIKLFHKEQNTEPADWMFALRIVNNKLPKKNIFEIFKEYCIDTRPFFYPINCHNHLKDIKYNDDIPIILNKEVIMIPSYPDLTNEQQEHVVDGIKKFIFYVDYNIKIIQVDQNNKYLLKEFVNTINSDSFRYFQKRDENIIENHVLTVLLYDGSKEHIFGYAHIDTTPCDNERYWFGLYLHPEYQGKGIGSKLTKYILEHYKVKCIDEVYLTVDNDNISAIKLYEKNNFMAVENNDKYILMKKQIKN